jgi:K+-transporting ATPase ATPase C chain
MSSNTLSSNTLSSTSIPAPALQDRIGLRAPLLFAITGLLGCGLLYSALGASVGRAMFPTQAQGSLLERDGRVVGSALLAQPFSDPRYFQPRPSAAGYDPMAASGSNLARSNPALRQRIDTSRATVAAREGVLPAQVPGDLLTTSGSGLDPHISPAAAQLQVARVAKARGLDPARVAQLLAQATEAPQFGVLGQPRVNVLRLNMLLDAAAH